jgi:hypothetical protein
VLIAFTCATPRSDSKFITVSPEETRLTGEADRSSCESADTASVYSAELVGDAG